MKKNDNAAKALTAIKDLALKNSDEYAQLKIALKLVPHLMRAGVSVDMMEPALLHFASGCDYIADDKGGESYLWAGYDTPDKYVVGEMVDGFKVKAQTAQTPQAPNSKGPSQVFGFPNPWLRQNKNFTHQNQIRQADPRLAEQLAAEAGTGLFGGAA